RAARALRGVLDACLRRRDLSDVPGHRPSARHGRAGAARVARGRAADPARRVGRLRLLLPAPQGNPLRRGGRRPPAKDRGRRAARRRRAGTSCPRPRRHRRLRRPLDPDPDGSALVASGAGAALERTLRPRRCRSVRRTLVPARWARPPPHQGPHGADAGQRGPLAEVRRVTQPGPVAGSGEFDLQMSDADALMWTVEKDPTLRSTVVTVLTLDRSPDWDALVERVERGSHLIPRLRQRVVTPMWRVGPPCWSADTQFDLSYHLRRVRAPEPGSFECVLDLARNAAMAGFDRARPLWEYTVVDGLEGGGAALVIKVHHSMTDGVGGMKMLMMLFDLERDPGPPGPADAFQDLPAFTPFDLVGRSLDYQGRRVVDIARHGLGNAMGAARSAARDPDAALQEATRVTRSLASFLAPATTPRSPIIC